MPSLVLHDFSWQRMVNAVKAVDRRQAHCVAAFAEADIPYAIIGGRASMAWVDSVDRGASRTTPNVDFLVERADLNRITNLLCRDGWIHQVMNGWHTFAESANVRFQSRVRLVFANELFRPDNLLATPSVSESCWLDGICVIDLDALMRMKLTAFRTIDRVHLDDLLSVGLFDPSWRDRFPAEFAPRLDAIFDAHDVWPDVFEKAKLDAGFVSDEQLAEFLRRSKELGDGKHSSLPWFLVRDNAWEKVRVA